MATKHVYIPDRLCRPLPGPLRHPVARLVVHWRADLPGQSSSAGSFSFLMDASRRTVEQHIQTIHKSARSSFPHTCEDTDPRLLSVIRSQLSTKIRSCCDYARAQGYPNLWIDACCIDKTSSAELSEAINSMFTWYSQADVCYVFLPDVPANENPAEKLSSFRRSIWFKRGWTLQELIVPSRTVFLSKDWRMIGTMAGLANVIEDVTGIDADILLHRRQLHTVSVAQRMSWAAGRETTRIEDEAYCLMGIFGVRLAVIYGEGAQAFVRLQEEIMKRIPDQSLFLWGIQPGVRCFPPPPATLWPLLHSVSMNNLRASKSAYLFASCPMDFFHSKGFTPIPLGTFSSMLGLPDASRPPLHTPSGYGVYTTLPVITLSVPTEEGKGDTKFQAAILACQDLHGRLPALLLSAEFSSGQHLIGGFEFHTRIPPAPQRNLRRYSLSEAELNASSESDDSSDDGGTIWARRPVISPVAVRYSRSYPRVVLLEPLLLKDAVSDSSLAILPLCVPHQRMPAVSEFAVLRRPPNPKSSSFAGLCMMIIPRWTLGHLSALGYSTSGSIKDGEMVSMPMSMRVRRGAMPRWYHNFTLCHATRGTISVAVSTCPFISRAPLHASVGWTPGVRHTGCQCIVITTEACLPTERAARSGARRIGPRGELRR